MRPACACRRQATRARVCRPRLISGRRIAPGSSDDAVAVRHDRRGEATGAGAASPPPSVGCADISPSSFLLGGREEPAARPAHHRHRSGSQWAPDLAMLVRGDGRGDARPRNLLSRSSRPQAKPESRDPLAPSAGVSREVRRLSQLPSCWLRPCLRPPGQGEAATRDRRGTEPATLAEPSHRRPRLADPGSALCTVREDAGKGQRSGWRTKRGCGPASVSSLLLWKPIGPGARWRAAGVTVERM